MLNAWLINSVYNWFFFIYKGRNFSIQEKVAAIRVSARQNTSAS